METETKKGNEGKFTQSLTFKGILIAVFSLLLLIPTAMIKDLIRERQLRSTEAIGKINEKWSRAQTLTGPVLTIPFTRSFLNDQNKIEQCDHELFLTPEKLDIRVQLYPEERHYGIYKTILYKSKIHISGKLPKLHHLKMMEKNNKIRFDQAELSLGISDLRGLSEEINFQVNGKSYPVETGGKDLIGGKQLVIPLANVLHPDSTQTYSFACDLHLNGSNKMDFIPIGQTTKVEVNGAWKDPGFTGSFSPDYQLPDNGFTASWSVLSFNRPIPEYWIDKVNVNLTDSAFGVNLVNTVDHYQQNMRSAKYALMFIALTFVVFFFVEVLSKKRIHPIQYLLVGFALVLFYSLLLSFSEQINFAFAYLIAAVATIALITAYSAGIFKNKMQTIVLASILSALYLFLYIVLQLEDVALLIGSVGLFIILGVIMYISQRIK
ncbi:MAG: cell envelope integrity protein CreD [Candidatus Symbiothrix sp.]|jgi:inner membrane protein|nr:cell envelope integrity protein CreD [Candidatus Symbiothrix sp.]